MSYPPEIRKALRNITIGQCAGLLGPLLFGNGFMLAYFLRLGVPSYRILFLFALLPLINMALTLPFAWTSDRSGKKKIGGTGLAVSIIGFFMLPLAAFTSHDALWWLTAGILIFSVGNAANGASWFALLSPLVPEGIRGRWFGQMRMSWQTTSILFSLGLTVLLRHNPELYIFQFLLAATGILMIVRLAFYSQIPELEPVNPHREGFLQTAGSLLKIQDYTRFCIYGFLLAFINGVAGLFGLLEKEVLGFSDSQLIMMGNLLSIGTIAGFFIGGKIVDHFGTKPVFLAGHIGLALSLTGILLRNFSPLAMIPTIGTILLLCGATQGAVGIAGTSELLALIPSKNKSLSTGFNMTLAAAGASLAGFLNGHLLKIKLLPDSWILFGKSMSAYDILFIGFLAMTALMAVTLGLVPTIRQIRSQWIPQNN
ncbi:MAG: MFS transporter [Kiritimatiellaceae bacterium]|nr:MFS transporter [Kiritimatiellaceae bacterium]